MTTTINWDECVFVVPSNTRLATAIKEIVENCVDGYSENFEPVYALMVECGAKVEHLTEYYQERLAESK